MIYEDVQVVAIVTLWHAQSIQQTWVIRKIDHFNDSYVICLSVEGFLGFLLSSEFLQNKRSQLYPYNISQRGDRRQKDSINFLIIRFINSACLGNPTRQLDFFDIMFYYNIICECLQLNYFGNRCNLLLFAHHYYTKTMQKFSRQRNQSLLDREFRKTKTKTLP